MPGQDRSPSRRRLIIAGLGLAAGARAGWTGPAGDPDYTPIWETPSPVVLYQGDDQMDLNLTTLGDISDPITYTIETEIIEKTSLQDPNPAVPEEITVTPPEGGSAPAAARALRRGRGRGRDRVRRRRRQQGRIELRLTARYRDAPPAVLRVIIHSGSQ